MPKRTFCSNSLPPEVATAFQYKADILYVNPSYLVSKLITGWLVEQGIVEKEQMEPYPI